MKNTITLLALAATAAATGFQDASPFSCPGNTDNKCTDKQNSGFDFSDLGFGDFSSYNNFNWKGWTCGSDGGKRFAPRTSGHNKISASCSSEKDKSPSFGCGADIDKFSLGAITIKPEFTCDLEFHYDMPDGSLCKHRSRCDESGTTVKNSQCGGAKNVTIVYPPQPDKPKPTCGIDVHTISFECSSSTKPPSTKTKTSTSTTPTSAVTTTSGTKETETTPATTAVETTSPPVETTSATSPVETTSPPATTSAPFGNDTTSVETTTPSETTSTFVTSFQSTSTVFTTVVSTITSCAATVTNCPAHSVTTTVVTVAVSTTICPVTETRTTVLTTKPTKKPTKTTSETEKTTSKAEQTTSETEAVGTTQTGVATTTATKPAETLPCPNVVPQCLNTFLFSVGCSDNTDAACYCPDEIFVKNIFDCIYAHGESAEVVSEAVIFFQGICAPHAPSNPVIATGATVTSYLTASATATASLAPVYTTVTVEATTVVPCTNSVGETIPSSSSTIVVSTAITVPQIGFTTGTGSASSVGLVPITASTAAAVTGGASTTKASTLVTAPPVGTGSVRPTQTSHVTVSSGGRVSAGFGFALAAMALVAAL